MYNEHTFKKDGQRPMEGWADFILSLSPTPAMFMLSLESVPGRSGGHDEASRAGFFPTGPWAAIDLEADMVNGPTKTLAACFSCLLACRPTPSKWRSDGKTASEGGCSTPQA